MRLRFAAVPALLAFALFAFALPATAQEDGEEPNETAGKADEVPASVAPAWHVGDWWKVECHPLAGTQPKRPRSGPDLAKDPTRIVTVSFRVAEMRTVGGNRCYAIEMTNDQFDAERVTFVIRASNLTVKQLELTDDGQASTVIENPAKTYLHQDTGLLIPLDFPRFPKEGKDETVADTVGTTSRELIQTTKFSADGRQADVEIKSQINGKPIVSVQRWEAGRPWWTEARRTYDATEMEAGKLVDWSGKKE